MATMLVIRAGKSANSICRLCFTEQEQYQSIDPLKEWIEKLTSLTITNVLNAPYSLCMECKATLEDFESFREMCLFNNRVFNETFLQENEVKVETETIPLNTTADNAEISNHLEDTLMENEGNKVDFRETSEVQPIKRDASTQVTRINKNLPPQCPTCGKFISTPRLMTSRVTLPTSSKVTLPAISQAPLKATSQEKAASEANPQPISQPTNNSKPYTCEQCGKQFDKRYKHKAHVLMHLKRFFCDYCGKGFPNTYLLKVHTQVHTGEKPFPCDVCGKRFFSKFNVKMHKQNLHPERP